MLLLLLYLLYQLCYIIIKRIFVKKGKHIFFFALLLIFKSTCLFSHRKYVLDSSRIRKVSLSKEQYLDFI